MALSRRGRDDDAPLPESQPGRFFLLGGLAATGIGALAALVVADLALGAAWLAGSLAFGLLGMVSLAASGFGTREWSALSPRRRLLVLPGATGGWLAGAAAV